MVTPESCREEHIDLSSGEWSLWMRPIAATRQVARHNELHPRPIDPLWPTRRNRLARGAPEHRRQAEGLEGADGKQVRVEGARDDGHHGDERIDDDSILDQERGREEEEGEGEGGLRPYVYTAVHEKEDRREDHIQPADNDARDHHVAHRPARFGTATGEMEISVVIRIHPWTAAACDGPPRRSGNSLRGIRRGSTGRHRPARRVVLGGRCARGGANDAGSCDSRDPSRFQVGSRSAAAYAGPRRVG